jgi:hypothetical protein
MPAVGCGAVVRPAWNADLSAHSGLRRFGAPSPQWGKPGDKCLPNTIALGELIAVDGMETGSVSWAIFAESH